MVQPTIEETRLSTKQAIQTYREGARITDVDALVVEDLSVYYETDSGTVKACDDVTFTLKQGERFALVGESGSGKTTLAHALADPQLEFSDFERMVEEKSRQGNA